MVLRSVIPKAYPFGAFTCPGAPDTLGLAYFLAVGVGSGEGADLLRRNALGLFFGFIFLAGLVGHAVAGRQAFNSEQEADGFGTLALGRYVVSSGFAVDVTEELAEPVPAAPALPHGNGLVPPARLAGEQAGR